LILPRCLADVIYEERVGDSIEREGEGIAESPRQMARLLPSSSIEGVVDRDEPFH
jgi:hypothetical protein